jgi:hypothetical protein
MLPDSPQIDKDRHPNARRNPSIDPAARFIRA